MSDERKEGQQGRDTANDRVVLANEKPINEGARDKAAQVINVRRDDPPPPKPKGK